ncbi:hypothetical protein EV643_105301 [Kribbella sp. VKM Ac-2527]|uniref:4-amino-4-deoxy-L-arabinose transferase-like glycosyltransferase n=1 Tax=Kribbella caucasensis TaxID=2512215 RepID=A0A4R6KGR1_9ACTN|nr:hypothetical protein [Kribbella sp. VKM Ac-2527]TDO50070.1 hypothetical protein EV643_105301 [Kribbella sp. VKM Ac-2527]
MRGTQTTRATAFGQLRRRPDETVLRAVVLAIAVVQAGVLGLLARRGSWLSDDLDFMVQGSRGFAPGELLTPLNDHIAPGLRFVYAVFAKVAPLNWDFTVGWRMLLQAIAIAMMGLLLIRLLGATWWVVTGTLFYALTPLSMPSFMSLSSGVNNLPAHVFGLLLLHATVDWYSGHRRRAVAIGPLSLLISLACWEKSGLILVTVLALALYLRESPLRTWLRQTWPFAVALVLPVVAFGILYATHGSPSEGNLPGPGRMVELGGRAFAVPLGALAGGPWTWSPIAAPFGTADAPVAAVILGAIVAAFLLFIAWREDRKAFLLWGSVFVYTLVTLFLVAYGRFDTFGSTFTVHYHYWSDLSIPLTLAAVLTARSIKPRVRMVRVAPAVALCCLLAWTAGVVISDTGFASLWGKNPARPYFDTVRAELDKAGPSVNLWDTPMPGNITTVLAADSRLSPVLRMAGIPFRLQGPGSDPYIVDNTGKLRTAELAVWSRAVLPKTGNPLCGSLVMRGVDEVTLPLESTLPEFSEGGWFARVGYLSVREPRLRLEFLDDNGRVVAMPEPPDAWPANLGTMYLGPAPKLLATSVRLRTSDPDTNLCVGSIDIGLPKVSGG